MSENVVSEYIFIGSESQMKITTDPALTYEPAPFHGTTTIFKLTPPSKGDPFKRFRKGH